MVDRVLLCHLRATAVAMPVNFNFSKTIEQPSNTSERGLGMKWGKLDLNQ